MQQESTIAHMQTYAEELQREQYLLISTLTKFARKLGYRVGRAPSPVLVAGWSMLVIDFPSGPVTWALPEREWAYLDTVPAYPDPLPGVPYPLRCARLIHPFGGQDELPVEEMQPYGLPPQDCIDLLVGEEPQTGDLAHEVVNMQTCKMPKLTLPLLNGEATEVMEAID